MKIIKWWNRIKSAFRDLTWGSVFGEYDPYGSRSVTGIPINEQKALQSVAVYACVSYIADYVASLPKITYERLTKGRNRATNHYLYPLIHDQPNAYMNDYEFVECLTGHVLLWGNAYAEIERDQGGRVTALWPLRPDRMRMQLYQGKIYYYYTAPNASEVQLLAEQVFHLRGMGSDGLSGYSPIQLHKESIGLGFAEQEYRARFFSNNASPGGILQKEGNLSDDAIIRLKKQWQEAHGGLSNVNRIAVLEEGVKWQSVGVPAKDMEFIEGRKYQKTEIASIYRVKPYKIGILEPGTVSFASVEAQQLDNHIDTMRPWVIRWEKKFNVLFSASERKRFYIEFLFDALMRADSESRARTLQIWRMNGIINADDWRELENRNPLPGGKGKDYWMPSNMMAVGEEPPEPELPAATTNGAGTNGVAKGDGR